MSVDVIEVPERRRLEAVSDGGLPIGPGVRARTRRRPGYVDLDYRAPAGKVTD